MDDVVFGADTIDCLHTNRYIQYFVSFLETLAVGILEQDNNKELVPVSFLWVRSFITFCCKVSVFI